MLIKATRSNSGIAYGVPGCLLMKEEEERKKKKKREHERLEIICKHISGIETDE